MTTGGSVDWLCLPRFDSQSVFGRLLDEEAGHFLIAPVGGGVATSRRYRPFGLVLDTTWETPEGTLVVSDALALGDREKGHGLGHSSPGALLRVARCQRGEVTVGVEYAPCPEFGLVYPRLRSTPGAVVAHGGATAAVLSTGVDMDLSKATATAVVRLSEGEDLAFGLTLASAWDPLPPPWSARRIRRRLATTEKSWRSWSNLHQRYEGPHRALVHHSGVVLKGLTYVKTGAVVAAATTSLPEGVGSARTWDYRYTWVRDASMTLQGLLIAACPDEAGQFFSFLATSASTQLDRGMDLQIMFGVGGERDLSEHELVHLGGWRASNDAWGQRQLDVYGALLDAAYTLRSQLGGLDTSTRDFLAAAADAAARRWRDDDQGIWEMRGPPRPFLHSKLRCWVAMDRSLAMSDALQPGAERVASWQTTRDDVRDAIVERGWSDRAGAFTQTFGSDDLDASTLLVAIVGFLPPDDKRVLSTIDAIERDLSDERGLLYRYRASDGLDGPEGTFLLCTFWLAHALAVTGQTGRARVVLDRAASDATELGLFSEQVDTTTGELLGNFPQAFSHLGLVAAAHALAAEVEQARTTGTQLRSEGNHT